MAMLSTSDWERRESQNVFHEILKQVTASKGTIEEARSHISQMVEEARSGELSYDGVNGQILLSICLVIAALLNPRKSNKSQLSSKD